MKIISGNSQNGVISFIKGVSLETLIKWLNL